MIKKIKFPKRAIYRSKNKNLFAGSLQNGEEIVFRHEASRANSVHAQYARPDKLWDTYAVHIDNLEEVKEL